MVASTLVAEDECTRISEMVEGSEGVEVQVMVRGRPGLICWLPAGEVRVRARAEGRRDRKAVVVRMVGGGKCFVSV